MKMIRIESPTHYYDIPLIAVAECRADWYSDSEGFKKHGDEWHQEVDHVMKDSVEGIDWLQNNTNFVDWKDIAIKTPKTITSYDFWFNSENFKIINNDKF